LQYVIDIREETTLSLVYCTSEVPRPVSAGVICDLAPKTKSPFSSSSSRKTCAMNEKAINDE
jgi:hypothetical protein